MTSLQEPPQRHGDVQNNLQINKNNSSFLFLFRLEVQVLECFLYIFLFLDTTDYIRLHTQCKNKHRFLHFFPPPPILHPSPFRCRTSQKTTAAVVCLQLWGGNPLFYMFLYYFYIGCNKCSNIKHNIVFFSLTSTS